MSALRLHFICLTVAVFVFILSGFIIHPIHLIVSDLRYNEAERNFNVVHKLFIDDFEDAIEQLEGIALNLEAKNQHPATDATVAAYIKKHFQMQADNKPIAFDVLGWKLDKDVIKIYAESESVRKVKKITLKVSFLFDLFDDQKNIVHVNYKKQKKSIMTNKTQWIGTLQFD
ncbi:MAG: hypothetical protein JJT94_04705 [Bernardetiaceae bacterium]|nr:hypothetical protein [Bernardetiaceae bacterium]